MNVIEYLLYTRQLILAADTSVKDFCLLGTYMLVEEEKW
jgi:hypothetical protein